MGKMNLARRLKNVWVRLSQANSKQKEAYCRWMHTLSAAAIIGAATIAFSRELSASIWYDASRVIALVLIGVLLFLVGTRLLKEE